MQNDEQIGNESITKLIFRFSLPATVGMVVMATYNIVDTIFIGRLGSEAIAALSIVFPLQMSLGAIGIGTGIGAASLISRSLGAGDRESAEKTVGQVISLSLIFGVLVFLLGQFYVEQILTLFGATPEIMALTREYAYVITAGSVMFFLIMSMNHVVRADGNPVLSMKLMVVSALTNIALDPIFIFALGLGVQGAAVATVLAKIVGLAIVVYYFGTSRSQLKLRASALKLDGKTVLEIYRTGLPGMILPLSKNVAKVVANNLLAGFGHVPVAVFGLFFRMAMLAIAPIIGFSEGLLPIMGYNYGAQKMERVKEAFLKGLGINVAFLFIIGAVYFISPEFLLRLFTSDPEVLAIGPEAVRILVLGFPLIGAQFVATIFFQAIGKGMPSLVLSLLREILLYIPLLFVLGELAGVTGIWIARPGSDFLASFLALALVMREFRHLGIPLHPLQLWDVLSKKVAALQSKF